MGDLEDARRIAERIASELSELVSSIPIEHRTISAMARWLGITRPVCQRVVQASRHRGDPLGVFLKLPGVQGLASFVAAGRDAGCDPTLIEAVRLVAVAYANLIDRHGGSRARLVAAIERHLEVSRQPGPVVTRDASEAAGASPSVITRQRIFEAVRELTRRELAAQVGVFIYCPRDGDSKRIDCVTALGLIGLQAFDGAMPLCPISTFAYGDPQELPDDVPITALDDPAGGSRGLPVGRLEAFCSDPPARVLARRRGDRVAVLVEPWEGMEDASCDVMLAARLLGVPHPALHEPRVQDCHVHSDGPAHHLVMTVYMHRSIALRCVAQTGAYVRQPVGTPHPAPGGRVHVLSPKEQWAHRLPDVPRLEYLGLGLENADTVAYPRQRELVAALCHAEGWNPEEFVGYRIQVEYPVWNAQYLMHFDFPDEED